MASMTPRALILLLLAAFAIGCGGTVSQLPAQAPALGAQSSVREEFDPQTLDDDDFLLQPPSGTAVFDAPDPVTKEEDIRTPEQGVRGYRVQIAAVLDRLRAQAFKNRSEQLLKQRVYVVYDERTRLYKLHVGNARTASAAETLRREIKSKGYPEAFIVRSRIETAPSPYRIPTQVGYRVQVFSASSRETAERAADTARRTLGRDDVYIAFEPPYFKVQVGDFVTKEEADAFVKTARNEGYDTPFPVRTQIKASGR